MAIRHIVCWQLNGADPAERHAQARAIRDELGRLLGQVPGLEELEVGHEPDPPPGHFDVVLSARFTDAAALERYQRHPLHALAVQRTIGSISGRVAVDYQI